MKTGIVDFDYWTKEEMMGFLDWCRTTNHPGYLLYWLAYETGMRASELIALKWDCIDFEGSVITIRRSFDKHTRQILDTTKNGKSRAIGINPDLKNFLRLEYQKLKSEFVFSKKNGSHITYKILYSNFIKDQNLAQVRLIGLHDIRHTYASHFVIEGGSIYDLKVLLGHADIETTMRYAHLAPNHLTSKAAIVSYQPSSVENVVPLSSLKFP